MSFIKVLERFIGRRSKRPELSPRYSKTTPDAARCIHASMLLTKWGNVEYYGPGKEEAEQQRRETLGLGPKEEVKKEKDDSADEAIAFFKSDLKER